MTEHILELETRLSIDLPNLRAASERSVRALAEVRSSASRYLLEHHVVGPEGDLENQALGIVAFGSLARQEMSLLPEASDFDHAIVAYRTIEEPDDIQSYRTAALVAQEESQLGKPGKSRLFGGLVSSSDLINRIGLEDDTNRSHTQRLLFLEESIAVVDTGSHASALKAILRRYLSDYLSHGESTTLPKAGVPRFLLNDVVRYWRTIAVDYQAKRWDELIVPVEDTAPPLNLMGDASQNEADDAHTAKTEEPKWGLRYFKLRSTRKLAFIGSVTSLFLPAIRYESIDENFLFDQFSMPPIERLGQLAEYLADEDLAILGSILEIADRVMWLLSDQDFRKAANKVQHPRDPTNEPAFQDGRQLTQDLQCQLESLFGSRRPLNCVAPQLEGDDGPLCLGSLTNRYLLF